MIRIHQYYDEDVDQQESTSTFL